MELIFDVGAHQGEDTEFYLKKGFRVVAVEAHPQLALHLRERFTDAIARGRLVVVAAAIADRDGEVEFFVSDRTVFGTIRRSWADRNERLGAPSRPVTVPAVRFDRLLEKHGVPYYLKVDIEGADMLCVDALERFSTRPRFVSIESTKTSWRDLVSEFEALEHLGYRRFKVVNQTTVPTQVEPTPPREGAFAGHRFAEGSAGLFGGDLPGRWLTRRQALLKYALIFGQYRFFGDNTRGQKIARKLPWRVHRFLIPDWYDTHAALGTAVTASPAVASPGRAA